MTRPAAIFFAASYLSSEKKELSKAAEVGFLNQRPTRPHKQTFIHDYTLFTHS